MMRRAALIVVPLALAALPAVADNYVLRLGTTMLMYATLASSWNVIGGMAGYPSFATAAFFGLGAYTGAVLQGAGGPILLCWLAAGLAASGFAGLLGLVVLRLRGHYFAIGTLVVAEVLRELVNTADTLTGGGMGLNLPVPHLEVTLQAQLFYGAMLALAAMAALAAWAVARSRLGFGLRCIQQNEDAALMLGVNTTLYKTLAFMVSAVFVGVAGAIYASWVHYIEPPDVFDVLLSIKPVVMVLIGGVGTLFGPILGAVMFLLLEELVWRNFLTLNTAILGVIITLLVLLIPGGLLSLPARWAK
jgi:branched-chain amino acid transport system permease protein